MKSLYFYLTVVDALSRDRLTLPTLPGVALRVSRLCQDPDISAARLAREVAHDAAISARLMRVANSAAYRGRPLDNLPQAVTRLGLALTRTLVNRIALEQLYVAGTPALVQRLRAVWARSLEVAALSAVLAARQPHLDPATAMLAGLLREIGVLPLLRLADGQNEHFDDPAELDEMVRKLQARVGTHLLTAWGFPTELAQIPLASSDLARRHDGPPDYADVVCVAAQQEQLARSGLLGRFLRPHLHVLDRLGLPQRFDAYREPGWSERLDAERQLLAA